MPPFFDFECKKCEIVKEHLVKNSEVQKECPKCGETMDKLVGCPSFRFKPGIGGFYVCDSKQGSDKREKLSDHHRKQIYKE